MKSILLLILAGSALAQAPVEKDVILRAMKDEIARARALRLVDEPPYFVEYSLDDGAFYYVHASMGALVGERDSRERHPRVRIRVGETKLDNANHIASDAYRGSRFDPFRYPLDDNYEVLRHCFWLATDRAYKQSLEALARKKASLKNVSNTENLADFSPAPAVKLLLPAVRRVVDNKQWRDRARELSSIFNAYPEIIASDVSATVSQTTSYLVNNEGTEIRFPDNLAYLRARASAIAPDGMKVHDLLDALAPEGAQLPSHAELKAAVTRVAENVRAMLKAPVGESYSGPVLFEGVAAAQLLAQTLSRNLSVSRRPVSDPDRPINIPTGELEGRIGSRILPEWIDVVDDPSQREWRGRALMGYYPVDAEGVAPKALPLVEKGVLKTYYGTRTPVQGVESTNGHGRIPGPMGSAVPLAGSVFVKASQVTTLAELKKKLLEMGKQRSKPYVMVVRKLDFPSSAAREDLARMARGQSGIQVSMPLAVFRVYADGREELVRGLRFRNVNARTLKDITAASDDLTTFEYLENGAPFARIDSGGYVVGTSIVAPSLLFEDIELEKIPGDWPKPPLAPAPPVSE